MNEEWAKKRVKNDGIAFHLSNIPDADKTSDFLCNFKKTTHRSIKGQIQSVMKDNN